MPSVRTIARLRPPCIVPIPYSDASLLVPLLEPMKLRKRGRRVDRHAAVIPIPVSAVPQRIDTLTESTQY